MGATVRDEIEAILSRRIGGFSRPIVDLVGRYSLSVSADNQAKLQDAIDDAPNGSILLLQDAGTYRVSGQLLVSGKEGLTFWLGRNTILKFDDGSYVGWLFDDASYRCSIIGGQIQSNDTSTPTMTLVKFTGASAYCTIFDTEFAYGGTDLLLAETYVCKVLATKHSNSDRYIRTTSAEGSIIDVLIDGPTFGTTAITANPAVEIASPGTRLANAYFETQTQSKQCILLATGAQTTEVDAVLENSGDIQVQTSVVATIGVKSSDSHNSGTSQFLRVDGGAVCVVKPGSVIKWASVATGVHAISASGRLNAQGIYIDRAGTGISSAGAGVINGNTIATCTTGIVAGSGCTARIGDQDFAGNTANITDSSGGTAKITYTSSGAASVADGGTITHGHPKTPTSVRVTPSASGEFASVTAIGATTFTVALKKHDNTAGTTQTVYWEASG